MCYQYTQVIRLVHRWVAGALSNIKWVDKDYSFNNIISQRPHSTGAAASALSRRDLKSVLVSPPSSGTM